MNIDTATLGATVTAIGALGLAACALVDTSKTLPGGGVSSVGFDCIEAAVNLFFPKAPNQPKTPNLAGSFLYTLHANWINGMAAADQKAVAKSLIKLRLTPDTSRQFAAVTQVDPAVLEEVARRMTTGAALGAQHTNALGRFDLALTAIPDAAYQRADQRYRNVSRLWGVLWPGDSRYLPVLDYPIEGCVALSSGHLLTHFLNEHAAGAASLSLVSHSLGARTVLETVQNLKRRVAVLIMMAGAIEDDCMTNEYALALKNAP